MTSSGPLVSLLRILVPFAVLASVSWWLPLEPVQLVSREDKKAPVQRPDFVDFREAIVETEPRVVFLGNSILGRAVDMDVWEELVDVPTLKMNSAGSASAMWFILMKNVLGPARPRPELAVVFFRDVYLTEPAFRVYGEYEKRIFFYAGDEEVELNRILYHEGADRADFFLRRHWSLYQRRSAVSSSLEERFKYGLVGWVTGESPGEIEKSVASTFDEGEMDEVAVEQAHRGAELQVDSDAHFDFPGRVGYSFLPALVRESKRSGIRLVLCRMRTARNARDEPKGKYEQAAERYLPTYIEALRDYAEAEGLGWLDFSEEDSLLLEYFERGDHFNAEGGRVFTRLLAERLGDELEQLE